MSVVDPHFTHPFTPLTLQRIPLRRRETLQAWDAADEYLLNHFFTEFAQQKPDDDQNILICNDSFGALCLNLHEHEPALYTDSHIAGLALAHNGQLNNLPASSVSVIPSTAKPEANKGISPLLTSHIWRWHWHRPVGRPMVWMRLRRALQ